MAETAPKVNQAINFDYCYLISLIPDSCFLTDINECEPNPCVYGNCTDLINNYSCSCDPGYNGRNCSESNSKNKF